MTDPMSDERLAEIRERAESVKTWKGYHAEPVPQLLDVDVPALLAEVERLRAELAVTGEKVTALRKQRDTAEAERDAAREQVKQLRALAEEALHLRQHGECAPGGTETWHAWDLKAPTALRALDGTGAGQ